MRDFTRIAASNQARSYIGTGAVAPPRWMLCPQTSHLQFFLHINFPSPVSFDAQM